MMLSVSRCTHKAGRPPSKPGLHCHRSFRPHGWRAVQGSGCSLRPLARPHYLGQVHSTTLNTVVTRYPHALTPRSALPSQSRVTVSDPLDVEIVKELHQAAANAFPCLSRCPGVAPVHSPSTNVMTPLTIVYRYPSAFLTLRQSPPGRS